MEAGGSSSSTPDITQTTEIEIEDLSQTREIEIEDLSQTREIEDLSQTRGIEIEDLSQTRHIYELVVENSWEDVLKFCKDRPQNKWLVFTSSLTVADDNILHLAVRHPEALGKLLKLLDDQGSDLVQRALFKKNMYENTPLHEAAAAGYADSTMLLVEKHDGLIKEKNEYGETAFYRAAKYGHIKVLKPLFEFLKEQHKEDPQQLEAHYAREKDSFPILHAAIYRQYIGTALWIRREIGDYVNLDPPFYKRKDNNGMTCLQLLANMPSVFKSGYTPDILTWIIYHCVDGFNDNEEGSPTPHFAHRVIFGIQKAFRIFMAKGWPVIKDIQKKKNMHQQVVTLAKLLAVDDFSWEESCKGMSEVFEYNTQQQRRGFPPSKTPQTSQANVFENSHKHQQAATLSTSLAKPWIEQDNITPLFLAAKNGITEVVRNILDEYPQAIDHVSINQQNILHVTILHRQRKVFRLVKKMVTTMDRHRLVGRVDVNRNTILHQAAITDYCHEADFPNPAYLLQDELRWFKRAKKLSPKHFLAVRNSIGKRPRDYFEETHRDLLEKARVWSKETAQSCSTVGVLMATIVFAAAYTVPGGSENGVPILLHVTLFKVFTFMDMVSLGSSLTSVVLFLSILSSPYKFEDFKISIPRRITLGFAFLSISITTAMAAFIVTILLTISLKREWTRSLIYFVGFLPVFVFALLHLPLIIGFQGFWKEICKALKRVCPECILARFRGTWKVLK